MKKITFIVLIFIRAVLPVLTPAQQPVSPLGFPLQLSGGFGDLRANHFHAGIDFRTKSSEGHALHAVLAGYISRVTVSPGGYGLAVYVTHPDDSLMTVYGHLQRFIPYLAETVKKQQYENESFTVDMSFNPGVLPVRQGDVIGFSGNTGSSGGPHLHFEVRDMRTNEWIDPLIFYKSQIPDTQKPMVRGLRIYPVEGKGMVNGSSNKQNITFDLNNNEQPTVRDTIEAWGEIGLGIRATDRMNGTNFTYGIKDILLTVDSIEIFRSYFDRLMQAESRYVNSYTDYDEWSASRLFYIKTFVEPGNKARFIASRKAGIINIDEERIYDAVITLTDLHGNACRVAVTVKGKEQEITPPDTAGTKLLKWYDYYLFSAQGIRVTFQRNSLYKNIYLRHHVSFEQQFELPVHTFSPSPVPLHHPVQLSIFIDSAITDVGASRYGIVQITGSGRRISWIGGVYRDGWMDAQVSELGVYTVVYDVTPPKITPLDPAKWREKKKISIRISDDLSGIASFRGEIDGSYALFEYDSKNALLTYTFDDERLQPGDHRLKLTVTDRGGNSSVIEHDFTW